MEAETDNDDYDIELTPEMVEFLRRSADRRRQSMPVQQHVTPLYHNAELPLQYHQKSKWPRSTSKSKGKVCATLKRHDVEIPPYADDFTTTEHTKKVVSEWVPYQQTAQKHMSALSELYGPAGASRIQQLETALNTNYDTHRDTRASVMWPSMPLRL